MCLRMWGFTEPFLVCSTQLNTALTHWEEPKSPRCQQCLMQSCYHYVNMKGIVPSLTSYLGKYPYFVIYSFVCMAGHSRMHQGAKML